MNSNKPQSVTRFLKNENQALGSLFNRLKQLERWKIMLANAMPEFENITEHCQLVRYESQQLFMITDSPHWVMRVRFHIPELLKKFRQQPEFFALKAIHCKAKPLLMKNYAKKVFAKPLPISKENAEMLLDTAQKTDDKKLRAALEKIATRT